jgi:hypothetical protein
MILQGINEIVGGMKDKKQGKKDLAAIEKQRDALTPKISSIAQEDLLNPYDKNMINMMQNSQAQRQANQTAAAGRNPLAAARMSSQNSQEGLQSDLAMLKFMDQKRSGARETFRGEEVSVMDKKWQDFLGRRGEAKDLIAQGKQRASQGLGAIDSAITSVATMAMGGGVGGAAPGATPPPTASPGTAPVGDVANTPVEYTGPTSSPAPYNPTLTQATNSQGNPYSDVIN